MSNWDAWTGLALPVAAIVLLGLAVRRGPADRHARVTREGGTVFLSERVMHRGYAWIDRLAAAAVRLGFGPDAVTWLSFALGLVAGVLIGFGWLGAAAWALAFSGLCDGIDGAVARRRGLVTAGGAVLDSALDRYVEFFVFAGLLVWFHDAAWPQLLIASALFGSFMVTYSTARAEALHITPPRGWMKRPERLVWLIGGAAFAATAPLAGVPAAAVMLGVVTVIAVFTHASVIVRLRAIRAAANARA